MKDKAGFYNIKLYTLLVFAFSGLLLLLHSVFVTAGDYWVVFPQLAPALTVIALLVIRGHKRLAFDAKRSFKVNKKVMVYCICATLFVFIVFGGFGFILSIWGKSLPQWKIPLLQWETPSLAIGFICVLAGCIGEKIGWRGFLLSALNRNLSLIISSLFIGALLGA